MKKYFLLLALFVAGKGLTQTNANDIIGRWDLTVTMGERIVPSWLEVKLSGVKTLVGYFVAEGGSARPISHITFQNGKVHFSIPPQWDRLDKYMELDGLLSEGQLKGTIEAPNGNMYAFVAERAPLLKREKTPEWGKSIDLLAGNTLKAWYASGSNSQWTVTGGVLANAKSGANLITKEKFEDFKLHIEFRYPKGSNSGVYLRGRYEVQVEDNFGKEPSPTYFGGIYGFLCPNEMAALPAGEWQSFDITLIGRRVTVVANGKAIITDQIIPGITGGALDSKEGEPGPIMLQGDHGPIEFRNILLTPAKKQ
jgi:hypothetical protein